MNELNTITAAPQVPSGVNHLVVNVRDIEESHRFWTDLLGFRHVGTSRRVRADGGPPTRFYSGMKDGKLHHHDIALYQQPALAHVDDLRPQSLDHIAIEYASEGAWRAQIRFLTDHGVVLHRLIERGATHSIHLTDPNGIAVELVFELPRAQWEDDIDGALNRAVSRPLPA
jgi:catechol 2,3-dioxygenase